MSEDDPSNAARVVGRVSIRPPKFTKEKPVIWFIQMETQFATNGNTQDLTKFHHALQALDADVLAEVSELLTNPPEFNKYEALKSCILREFQDSEEKRLKTLLNQTELGIQRPSHLLRRMRDLAENKVSDELLKSLWMQRLPTNTQTVLSTSEDTLDKLATMADRIHDIVPTNVCMEVTPAATGTSPWDGQLSEIIKRLDRIESKHRKASPRRRERSGSRSCTRSLPASSEHCWYHKRFGQKAKKCTSPCNWNDKSSKKEEN
ncbi:PREDICTED: uncharacterized protein LOC108758226 [Trachymyrmex cornetzi]|uniref:uncharacterized protein LOC108758226 n=1 Tax=Trachymyrmex cornetzi TaxID=471704 RepID=UPI00084EDCE5|nr:PREDICTED: uncharacterized protein LOC108758226 [Trachymyrmex cornetzi]